MMLSISKYLAKMFPFLNMSRTISSKFYHISDMQTKHKMSFHFKAPETNLDFREESDH